MYWWKGTNSNPRPRHLTPARTNQSIPASDRSEFEGKDCKGTESAMKEIKGQRTEVAHRALTIRMGC
jgi:hypothetical protein